MSKKQDIIFIVGPTSSGKTVVAASLAKRIDGEIISCDSMQIYKGMEIITQAPSEEILREVPHHLVSVVEPEEEYSAARYAEEAGRVIEGIIARKKVPIFSGGTGLYMKALLDGIFPSPSKDERLREKYAALAEIEGSAFLHDKLKVLDPETAVRLHPNDLKRIIRALEVSEASGKAMSEMKLGTKGIADNYNVNIFGLKLERPVLYERIDAAVERMFDAGLVNEVEGLLERSLGKTARKAIGIKEIAAALAGDVVGAIHELPLLDQAKEEIKKNTRRYAKRQLTWFNADKRVVWIDANKPAGEIAEEIWKKRF